MLDKPRESLRSEPKLFLYYLPISQYWFMQEFASSLSEYFSVTAIAKQRSSSKLPPQEHLDV